MPTPLPTISGLFRCAINWVAPGGQHAENVIHIHGADANPTQVATALNTYADTGMFGSITGGIVAPTVSITPLDGSSPTTDHALTNWLGSGGGSQWLPAVAVTVTEYTAVRGRRYRGRLYLPFTDESGVTDGKLNAGISATLTAAWQEFQEDLLADPIITYSVHVASYGRPDRRNPLGWSPFSTIVQTFQARDVLSTQRRRQSRVA